LDSRSAQASYKVDQRRNYRHKQLLKQIKNSRFIPFKQRHYPHGDQEENYTQYASQKEHTKVFQCMHKLATNRELKAGQRNESANCKMPNQYKKNLHEHFARKCYPRHCYFEQCPALKLKSQPSPSQYCHDEETSRIKDTRVCQLIKNINHELNQIAYKMRALTIYLTLNHQWESCKENKACMSNPKPGCANCRDK
jgi:hypothetical protein